MEKLPNVRPRLFCPGPTPVPNEAAIAALHTNIYHRSADFKQHFQRARSLLCDFFDSPEGPIILTSSGTGALEAALVNLTSPGDEILVINGGKFGERWQKLGQTYQCSVDVIEVSWGQSPEINDILTKLQSRPNTKALFLQANETSTGVAYPIEEIARAVRKQRPEILIVVDAVSALVAHHVKLKSWDLDCVISGSQKGFGVPPGLAFLALSERAWSHISKRPRFYFDLLRERQAQAEGQTAWTPATTLVLSLEVALQKLHEIGVDACVAHHALMAKACRAAAGALGLELYSQSHHSQALTAIRLPSGMDGSQLVKVCREKFGAIFAGGQDQAKGTIIRIAHLGVFDQFDIITALSAFEFGLREMGSRHDIGVGVQAAMKTMTAG
ncbi:MAG: pyridoxal-phosphate-dependent aminotransferase family protein [Oligoflexus sp.]